MFSLSRLLRLQRREAQQHRKWFFIKINAFRAGAARVQIAPEYSLIRAATTPTMINTNNRVKLKQQQQKFVWNTPKLCILITENIQFLRVWATDHSFSHSRARSMYYIISGDVCMLERTVNTTNFFRLLLRLCARLSDVLIPCAVCLCVYTNEDWAPHHQNMLDSCRLNGEQSAISNEYWHSRSLGLIRNE